MSPFGFIVLEVFGYMQLYRSLRHSFTTSLLALGFITPGQQQKEISNLKRREMR